MFPHPLLMARIGESFGELRNDDLIREIEQEAISWQNYAHELERRLAVQTTRYEGLKDILSALSADADSVFTAAVSIELREKLATFLKMIP